MFIDLKKKKLSLVNEGGVPLDGLRQTALNAGTLGQCCGHSHEDHVAHTLFVWGKDISSIL